MQTQCLPVKVVVTQPQSCPTLGDAMDWDPPGSSGPWNSVGKNTGVGCHFLLQGIFPTQGSSLGLPHCRQIIYRLTTREASTQMCAHLHVGQHIYVQVHTCMCGSVYTCTHMAQHVNVHMLTCDSTSMCVICSEWFRNTCEVGVSLYP